MQTEGVGFAASGYSLQCGICTLKCQIRWGGSKYTRGVGKVPKLNIWGVQHEKNQNHIARKHTSTDKESR